MFWTGQKLSRMYASKEIYKYEVSSNINIPIYCILTRLNQREKQWLYYGKIWKHIELLKKGLKGCRCKSWMQRNTQSLFLPIVTSNIMFIKKNRFFSENLKLLGSRLACQGCGQCPCLSRNEFWEVKLNQMIRARRDFSEASSVCSGLPFSSGLDLWLPSDIIFCLTSKMIPRHDVAPNVGVPLAV